MKTVFTLLAIGVLCAPAAADVAVDVRFGHGLEVVPGAITPLVVELTARHRGGLGVSAPHTWRHRRAATATAP